MGEKLGHTVIGLLDQDDIGLVDCGLLTPRYHPDKSGINENDAHLTALGILFCRNVETYCLEISTAAEDKV